MTILAKNFDLFFMRKLLPLILLLIATATFSQTEDIYKLAFSNPANFKLTTHLRHKQPKKIIILDTTQQWNPYRFWLEGVNLKSKETLKQFENDEHHPYYHTYLFIDPSLDKEITDDEKLTLKKRANDFKTQKIKLLGNNYSTVKSVDKLLGFYFITTQPVFSTDKKFAFIDLHVFYKDSLKQNSNQAFFGTICIVYKRENGIWKKFKLRDWLLL
jgi:hypothetical protein